MGQDAVGWQRGAGRSLSGMDALHQGLGIGLSRKLDEPGSQVLLQGPATQSGAGGQFVAGLVGDIPDCD